jgi:predicted MPP superfamily phosphohydrolase
MMILWLLFFFGLIAYAITEGCYAIRDYPIPMYIYIGVFLVYVAGAVGTMFFSRHLPFHLARFLSIIFSPFLMLFINLAICFAIIDIVRIINLIAKFSSDDLRNIRIWWFVGSLSLVLLLYFAGWLNFQFPRVVHLDLESCDCPVQHRELRIVAASDLHLGFVSGTRRLRKWVTLINSLNPDLVVLVGDITDGSIEPVVHQRMHEELNGLLARYGVFAVSGNHEYFGGEATHFEDYVKRTTRIHYLRDSHEVVNDSVIVVGRDDKMNPHRKSLDRLLAELDRSKPIILLDHQPIGLKEAADCGVTLQLSGHTHGGQFFPGNLFARLCFEIVHGYRRIGNTHYFVTSGLGVLGPQCRLGSNSEVVCITLTY